VVNNISPAQTGGNKEPHGYTTNRNGTNRAKFYTLLQLLDVSQSSLEHGTVLELFAASSGVEQYYAQDQCFACKWFCQKIINMNIIKQIKNCPKLLKIIQFFN
jgi:hypothetical protein